MTTSELLSLFTLHISMIPKSFNRQLMYSNADYVRGEVSLALMLGMIKYDDFTRVNKEIQTEVESYLNKESGNA
ncbi:hypothetical protein D3C80_1954510 [compost metagenome]